MRNKSILLIAVIFAGVATALFLVIGITPLSISAYIVALIGIAALYCGTTYAHSNTESYPWIAAIPARLWQYLATASIISVSLILAESLLDWSLQLQWFYLIHIILAVIFFVPLILMQSGKEIIEQRGEKVHQKVATLRFMQMDAESLISKYPEHENDLRQVADALRYSDPMSHPSIEVFEEQIQGGIHEMNDIDTPERIPERCSALLRQIADRNLRVKMMK